MFFHSFPFFSLFRRSTSFPFSLQNLTLKFYPRSALLCFTPHSLQLLVDFFNIFCALPPFLILLAAVATSIPYTISLWHLAMLRINGEFFIRKRKKERQKAARACKKLGNFKWLKFYAWRDKINNLILNAKLNFSNIPSLLCFVYSQTTKSFLKPALLLLILIIINIYLSLWFRDLATSFMLMLFHVIL